MDITNITANDVPLFSLKGLNVICKLVKVIDGDTGHFILLLPQHEQPVKYVCRLNGIDTPEMSKTPEIAKKARNRFLQLTTSLNIDLHNMSDNKLINEIIHQNKKIIYAQCLGSDKYGRQLISLYDNELQNNINNIMVNEGYARVYDGGYKEAWV